MKEEDERPSSNEIPLQQDRNDTFFDTNLDTIKTSLEKAADISTNSEEKTSTEHDSSFSKSSIKVFGSFFVIYNSKLLNFLGLFYFYTWELNCCAFI